MQNIDVSVIIVSYNVPQLLLACIASVYQSVGDYKCEIIVIDNNSADNSVALIKAQYPEVQIISNSYNNGFSGANNQGIAIAKGKYLFLLNPDTEIIADGLSQLIELANSKAEIDIIGPRLLNSNGSLQISAWKKPMVYYLLFDLFYLKAFFNPLNYTVDKYQKPFSPQIISGAAIFAKKEVFQTLKGLDENLFWMEDVDFSIRAQKSSFSIIYIPSIQVFHHSGKSAGSNQKVAISNQILSKIKYYKKHSYYLVFVLAALLSFLIIISRLVISLILAAFSPKAFLKFKIYKYAFTRFISYLFLNDKRIT